MVFGWKEVELHYIDKAENNTGEFQRILPQWQQEGVN